MRADRVLDWIAFILACTTLIAFVVGIVKYGYLPLNELPSWVWFLGVMILFATWRKKNE